MRNIIIVLSIVLIAIICGCSKGGSYRPLTPSDSQWSFSGVIHSGDPTAFNGGTLESSSSDSKYILAISFNTIPVAGTYVVTDDGNGSCSLMANINNDDYYSEQGGTVKITVNGGKVTAVFSNIRMKLIGGTTEALISGKLVDQ